MLLKILRSILVSKMLLINRRKVPENNQTMCSFTVALCLGFKLPEVSDLHLTGYFLSKTILNRFFGRVLHHTENPLVGNFFLRSEKFSSSLQKSLCIIFMIVSTYGKNS